MSQTHLILYNSLTEIFELKLHLKDSYNAINKEVSNKAIASILIILISSIYIGYSITVSEGSSLIFALLNREIATLVLVGFLNPGDVDGERVLMLVRVSSASQGNNTSKSSQKKALKEAVEEIDGTVVEILEAEESAAEIERGQLNRALEMAENDEYDILMVYVFDRLSRAKPWDTIQYLYRLRQAGVTLYCHSQGYIDWSAYYDFEILAREAVFSRRWYARLKKGRVEGCMSLLEEGKWPFGGDPPVGYTTDDENYLKLDEQYATYVPDIFRIYLETENRKETERLINTKLENAGLETISYSQIGTILKSKLVLGRLEYDGELATTNPEFKIVDKSLFEKVQALFTDNESEQETVTKPEFLGTATERFGLDYVMELFDLFTPFRCRSCGGDLEQHGVTQRIGIRMPNYRCTECDNEDPLLNGNEIQKLHQTLPLRCPYCTAVEDFQVKELRTHGSVFDYKYTCELCDHVFGSDMEPDQIRRMLNNDELQFSISRGNENTRKEVENANDDQQTFDEFS